MLLEQVAEIHDGGAIRQGAIQDNRANRRMEAISYRASSMAPSLRVVPMLHAVNTQHGLQRIGPSAIARLGAQNGSMTAENGTSVADLSRFERGNHQPAGVYRVDLWRNDEFIGSQDIVFESTTENTGDKSGGLMPCFNQ